MATITSAAFDMSGNNNHWTLNNINETNSTLTTYDIMNDVATLTDEDTANFATLNPLVQSAGSFSDGNLKATMTASTPAKFVSTIAVTSGTWYMEYSCNWGASSIPVGISADTVPRNYLGMSDGNTSVSFWPASSSTPMYINGVNTSWSGSATIWTSADICGLALDATNRIIYVYKNGSLIGSYNFSAFNWNEVYFAGGNYVNGLVYNANFGQRPFAYTPPTGYLKLNTYNLPDSTIVDGSQYFDTSTWTATGSSTDIQTPFSPDFVWIKDRVISRNHYLIDTVRGNDKTLISNLIDSEYTLTNTITSFNSDGYTISANAAVNSSGETYVGWSWRGSDSSAVSNTDGTITSTVSANTDSGFSVVTWTGNGSAGATIGHGLGSTPQVIINKGRSYSQNWVVYHSALGPTKWLQLNSTVAQLTETAIWNNTAPTSSKFTVGTSAAINPNGGTNVAYCFAEVEGFSKFGSYTGNGSADGPFVYTGFRPAFVMYKRTDSTGPWILMDSKRATYNVVGPYLSPNLINAEATVTIEDFVSNGFKIRNAGSGINGSGEIYIYMAFAENPFKNSLAR